MAEEKLILTLVTVCFNVLKASPTDASRSRKEGPEWGWPPTAAEWEVPAGYEFCVSRTK